MTNARMLRVASVAMLVGGFACSSADGPAGYGEHADPVYGGTPETSRGAVMALIQQSGQAAGACSGTNIAVDGRYGYLLTAAHCLVERNMAGDVILPIQPVDAANVVVVPGTDYSIAAQGSSFHPVQDYLLHPSYDGNTASPADIAVVRWVGADATTPILPAMTSAQDDLMTGTSLTFVGYGQTETNSMNSVRFEVTKPIAQLTAQRVAIDQSDGRGTCQGDSGGPGLRASAGGELVASVTSFGVGGCATGSGWSVRVSSHQAFIEGYVNAPPPALDCGTCRAHSGTSFGSCSVESSACTGATACGQFVQCANGCPANDAACIQQCASQFPGGQQTLATYFDCTCTNDCATECASDCAGPACGLGFADTTCNSCNEARCCAATQACADDSACFSCATDMNAPDSCFQNQAFQAFRECNLTECNDECGGNACGFTNPGECGNCINDSCCDEGFACQIDGVCAVCASGGGTTQLCTGNAALSDLLSCLATCSGDPCMTGLSGGTGGTGGASGTGGVSGSAGAPAGGGPGVGGSGGFGMSPGAGGTGGFGVGTGGGTAGGTAGDGATRGTDPGSTGGCSVAGHGTREGHTVAWVLCALAALLRRRRR